jgi:hypothetical protein
MLYRRREERARSAALLDGVGTRRGGVLALAVLTMLWWPASAATSTTIHALVQHPAPAAWSPGHQRELGTHRPVRDRRLARGEGRRGHPLQFLFLGVMMGELDADGMVAASWRRFKPGRGGQGDAAFGARAPPAASRLS